MGLADTACGLATRALLPEGATGFTTIELKSNLLGTAREGRITDRGDQRRTPGGRRRSGTPSSPIADTGQDDRAVPLHAVGALAPLNPPDGNPRVTPLWRATRAV